MYHLHQQHNHEFHHVMPLGNMRCVYCGAAKKPDQGYTNNAHPKTILRNAHHKIVVAYT